MTPIPQVGDVIVHNTRRAATGSPYSIGIYKEPLQLHACSDNAARRHASSFALQHKVDVWYTEDAQHYSCLGRFR